MNLNQSLASFNETLNDLIAEGAAMFGATEEMPDDERADCARRWSEALMKVEPMGFLEPAGVWEEDGETGFFYDPPTPGTPNAARLLAWMQGAHETLKTQFFQ